jgi:hypothetical protein
MPCDRGITTSDQQIGQFLGYIPLLQGAPLLMHRLALKLPRDGHNLSPLKCMHLPRSGH